jgi:hypothetical protein
LPVVVGVIVRVTVALPLMEAPGVLWMAKPVGAVPFFEGDPLKVTAPNVPKAAVAVFADAAAAGAAIAAAITGTLHAAPFITARRSKLVFGAARLFVSDIFYPKF